MFKTGDKIILSEDGKVYTLGDRYMVGYSDEDEREEWFVLVEIKKMRSSKLFTSVKEFN